MLIYDQLYEYQRKASDFQCSRWASMVWADCGLGKTIITLTSIARMVGSMQLQSVLVVAPMRVCTLVWRQEAAKWQHTQHLTFMPLTGCPEVRTRCLQRPADIYLINYEKLRWLGEIAHKIELPFNGVVWDEITKLKNSTTKRVKAVAEILPHMKWRTGLTATPASNGLKDLHGQYLVTDFGKRLGTSKKQFQQRYFYADGPYKIKPFDSAGEEIQEAISDMTLEMSAEDYNPLPDLIVNDVMVELPIDVRDQYETLEKEFFMQLESGNEIEVFNTATLFNKCLQLSNGAVILDPDKPGWEDVHDTKLNALADIIEGSGDEPIFLAYAFRADAERIMERFKKINPINLTACKGEAKLNNAMDLWKSGGVKLMIAHPASCGHGIDGLQEAGHTIVWFGLNWSLDFYEQFNGRIRRQGIGSPPICHRILSANTLDVLQSIRLQEKSLGQSTLRSAVKRYRESKGMVVDVS